jgi:DNA-binding response OmpR family regulator
VTTPRLEIEVETRASRRKGSAQDLRVIIVEDNFLLARRLAELMEGAGFSVAGLAGNPEAAVELIERRDFDVALLDVMLGSRSVKDVALRLHAEGRPIVFLSGYNDLEMLPPELRSVPRLAKPVEPSLLLRAIRDVTRSAR